MRLTISGSSPHRFGFVQRAVQGESFDHGQSNIGKAFPTVPAVFGRTGLEAQHRLAAPARGLKNSYARAKPQKFPEISCEIPPFEKARSTSSLGGELFKPFLGPGAGSFLNEVPRRGGSLSLGCGASGFQLSRLDDSMALQAIDA